MKQYLSILAFAVFFTSGFSQTATRISFIFKGYDESKHKGFVEVVIPHIVDPFSQQIKINENGTFDCSLNISKEREILINYDNKVIPLIVTSGDQVKVVLNLTDYLENSADTKAKISGDRSKVNYLIISFGNQLKRWTDLSSAFYADNTLKLSDYKEQRIKEMDRQMELLNNLIRGKKIREPGFVNWAQSKIRYAAGADLCLFPFIGRINKELSDKSEYFDFLSKINPNETQKVLYDSYFKYLDLLCTSYTIIANTSNEYEDQRVKLKNDKVTNFSITWSILSRLPAGAGKEYLFAKLFQSEKDRIPPQYRDSLPGKVNPALMNALLKMEGAESATVSDLLKSYQISEPEKKGLLDIYSAAKGKVIYHDFLIRGCGPCLAELPRYNEWMEKAGEDVVFVFIGVDMKQADLEKLLSKDQVKGRHYVISKNQLAFYERYFGLRAFPHHHVVNKDGMIVRGQVSGPGNYSIDQILNKLK